MVALEKLQDHVIVPQEQQKFIDSQERKKSL
jgi:hypothetical protein